MIVMGDFGNGRGWRAQGHDAGESGKNVHFEDVSKVVSLFWMCFDSIFPKCLLSLIGEWFE